MHDTSLYITYGNVISLLFEFTATCENATLAIESVYFLVCALRQPLPELVMYIQGHKILDKFALNLKEPVFEARTLDLKTGIEVLE